MKKIQKKRVISETSFRQSPDVWLVLSCGHTVRWVGEGEDRSKAYCTTCKPASAIYAQEQSDRAIERERIKNDPTHIEELARQRKADKALDKLVSEELEFLD